MVAEKVKVFDKALLRRVERWKTSSTAAERMENLETNRSDICPRRRPEGENGAGNWWLKLLET